VRGQALDVHAEDVPGAGDGVLGRLGELHTAGLASTTRLHLRLDHHPSARSWAAAAAASSALVTTVPTVTGTPCLANSSLAWYSIRCTIRPSFALEVDASARYEGGW
jgi:hypothetical protein